MNEDFGDINPLSGQRPTTPKLKGIFEYFLIIRDRWLLAIALSLPIALGFVYNKFQEPELYQTSSTFRVEPPLSIINNMQPVDRDRYSARIVGRHLEAMRSGELRKRMVKTIDLTETTPHPKYGNAKAKLLAPYVKDGGIRPTVSQVLNYTVSLTGEGTPILKIIATARNGEGAAMVANLAQDEYEKIHQNRKGEKHDTAITFLEGQLKKSREAEQAIDRDIREFKLRNNLAYIEDEKKDAAGRKSRYQDAITGAQVDKLQIQSTLRQIIAVRGKVEKGSAAANKNSHTRMDAEMLRIKEFFEISAIADFGNVQALRQKLLDLETTRKEQERKGYLERHPAMINNTLAISEIHKLLKLEVKTAIEDLTNRVSELASQESEFNKAMSSVQLASQKLDNIETQILDMKREKEVHRQTYDSMLTRLNEIRVTRELPQEEDDPLRRGDQALIPGWPISPDKADIKNKGIMIFMGCFIVIPILFEFVDNRVKSPWDIEVFIGRDIIAGIPKISTIKEADRPLIVGNELDDGLMESFRSMYSRIQMNSQVDYPKSMLITSAIPSEGKSLLAANFAYSCANHGRRTILLDFDLRRPGLHKFCGVSNDRGILTLINEINGEHDTEAERKALTEIYPNLYILPSGGKTRAATEMLERADFDLVLNNLKKLCDVLIMDSPPLGLFPDSMAMARKVDEVLFVTRYGKVARKVVKNLLSKVEETGANILGVVLNDLPEKKTPGYYYAGYYGYGYFRYKYYNKY
ncbi:MAG: polysaccharide biosynthesis tyrosine autokinase, partial [Opitutales bacterium]